ncbi:MAG: PAS domain-containing protein [Coriobacteriia bacterium]|nr:PAS domain-containing protein [Coriobacteriia bacterium]
MASDRTQQLEAFSVGDAGAVLEALMRRSGECIHVLDLDGRVVRWNAACECTYGWRAASVLGEVLPFALEARKSRVLHDIRMLAASGKVTEREGTFVRPDGSRIRARMTVIPVSDHDGLPCGVAVVSREALSDERLDRQRNEIADYVAQGLAAPLSVIANTAALMARAEVGGDPARRARLVASIQAQARIAGELVNDLTNVSLLARGELLLNREPADARAIASRAVASLGQDGRRVVVDFDPTVQPLPVDAAKAERAIQLLTRQTIDSLPAGGLVSVSVLDADDEVIIRIVGRTRPQGDDESNEYVARPAGTDDGIGAAEAGVMRYLARGLIEAHGGTMSADILEAGGRAFELRLPADGGPARLNGRTNLG